MLRTKLHSFQGNIRRCDLVVVILLFHWDSIFSKLESCIVRSVLFDIYYKKSKCRKTISFRRCLNCNFRKSSVDETRAVWTREYCPGFSLFFFYVLSTHYFIEIILQHNMFLFWRTVKIIFSLHTCLVPIFDFQEYFIM